jgi:SAM-dependent methyltransferase
LYAKVRPHYPQKLFQYLASVCDEHKSAWDAVCGNGQAAVSFARYFKEVQASDISEQQIAHAIQNPKVTCSVQPVEATNFVQNKFDLVCVAQALHWFDLGLFWPEVKRVLKPGGIFAAWGYTWFSIENGIDEFIREKILRIIDSYWAPQVKLL